jgi:hypothetical protein
MRFRKRTDRPVSADGTADCRFCGEPVAVDTTGHCALGHRVTNPESVPAAAGPSHGSDDGAYSAEAAGTAAQGRPDDDRAWDPVAAPVARPVAYEALSSLSGDSFAHDAAHDAAHEPADRPAAHDRGDEPATDREPARADEPSGDAATGDESVARHGGRELDDLLNFDRVGVQRG